MSTHQFQFISSVDGTGPLYGDATFESAGGKRPVIAVMQGFSGDRSPVKPDVERLAAKGLFAVSVDARGRGLSAGRRDCGAVEIADIVDGLHHAITLFPQYADETNLNVVGYSGGGANALSLVTKFPDLFRVAVSYFGISDYALWYEFGGRPDCDEIMRADLEGTPAERPREYEARSSLRAARNALCTEVHLYWDEEETGCPPMLNTRFKAACDALGYRNCFVHESRKTDPVRWHHGYTTNWPELIEAEKEFVPRILSGAVPEPRLPKKGRLAVPGFVITRHFQLWVGNGKHGVADVEYDVSGAKPAVKVISYTPGQRVRIVT